MHKELYALLIWISIFLASAVGWVLNIIELFRADAFSGEVIARAIGVIVAPLGAIFGYF